MWYSDNKVSLLKTFLDFSMIPIPLAIFLLMYLICADHLSLLSMITPRNFVSFTSCILVWFITMWSAQWEEYLGINNIKLVLSMFKDNLFAFTHFAMSSISLWNWGASRESWNLSKWHLYKKKTTISKEIITDLLASWPWYENCMELFWIPRWLIIFMCYSMNS